MEQTQTIAAKAPVNSSMISRKRSILDISSSKQQQQHEPRKVVRVISALPDRLLSSKGGITFGLTSSTSTPSLLFNTKNGNKKQKMSKKSLSSSTLSSMACPSPQEYLLSTLQKKQGIDVKVCPFWESEVESLFVKPTSDDIASYGLDIVDAVRKQDMDTLRKLYTERKLKNCSNQFGESVLHLACRKGLLKVVQFLVQEVKAPVWVKDDFGRTVLHDACWACVPNFDLIDIILNNCPDLLYISDARGHTPLSYTRREHWPLWMDYLKKRITSLQPTKIGKSMTAEPKKEEESQQQEEPSPPPSSTATQPKQEISTEP